MADKALIMDESAMNRALTRIAHEIIEAHKGVDDIAIIGIQRRGVILAKKIAELLEHFENKKVLTGILDITLYRDDLSLLSEHPVINGTDIGFVITGRRVVLVDDVLFTGRTAHAAINALMDMGRAASVKLAVMIDRGHRELPIRADFVGKNVPTSRNEVIHVKVTEYDGTNAVTISDLF